MGVTFPLVALDKIGSDRFIFMYISVIFIYYRSIRRIVFYSLIKPRINEKGEKEMEIISVSSALQIGGRAGRYGTQWEHVSSPLFLVMLYRACKNKIMKSKFIHILTYG